MSQRLETGCCIAGGGPAGMMLGYLLSRAGVKVTVLEKHADFLRDFRGDTVHPSTLEVMHDLGLLEAFLRRPHDEVDQLSAQIGDTVAQVADFRHLPTHARFIAFMPQWEFLDFLAGEARRFAEFQIIMRAEAREIITEEGCVVGVTATTADGPLEIRAPLTVGADGRASAIREQAGLRVVDLGAPMDVLWMRLPRKPDDPNFPLGRIDAGRVFVMITRDDYFQCAYLVAKGQFEAIRAKGLEAFHDSIVKLVPAMADRVQTLGRCQTADRDGQPAGTLVAPWPAVHRRRRPRHVAGGRRRHQPGHPGRRGRGQHSQPAPGRGPSDAG